MQHLLVFVWTWVEIKELFVKYIIKLNIHMINLHNYKRIQAFKGKYYTDNVHNFL